MSSYLGARKAERFQSVESQVVGTRQRLADRVNVRSILLHWRIKWTMESEAERRAAGEPSTSKDTNTGLGSATVPQAVAGRSRAPARPSWTSRISWQRDKACNCRSNAAGGAVLGPPRLWPGIVPEISPAEAFKPRITARPAGRPGRAIDRGAGETPVTGMRLARQKIIRSIPLNWCQCACIHGLPISHVISLAHPHARIQHAPRVGGGAGRCGPQPPHALPH